jgi:zinc/manganese transport system permease protein
MAVGLMMVPAVSSRMWHVSLVAQLINASLQAMLASMAGLLLSYHFDTPSGPTIIGCAGALYFLSLLFAQGGWLTRWRKPEHKVA